jgi:hypothetical protein
LLARAEAIHRARGSGLTRVRQHEYQAHSSRRAYQIETARMLIAIEFFLVVIIIFLSLSVAIAHFPARVTPGIM